MKYETMNKKDIANGLVIVNDMFIQKSAPKFRSDEQYEEHVLQVFNQYADWAVSRKAGLLFTGHSIKNISVKQALMLSELSKHIPLFVVAWQLHLVNSALVEMNCVSVLEQDEYDIGSSTVYIAQQSTETGYDKQIVISASPEVLYYTRRNSDSYSSMKLGEGLQRQDAVLGMGVAIGNALKPVVIESDYDDSEWLKEAVNEAYTPRNFGFMEQIKVLNEKAKSQATLVTNDDISAIQHAINGMAPSEHKTFLQELHDTVTVNQQISAGGGL